MNNPTGKRALYQKLGLKPGQKACFLNTPPDYFDTALFLLPDHLDATDELSEAPFDFIQVFCTSESELEDLFPKLTTLIQPKGMIWITWPKKSSAIPTEVDMNLVRASAKELQLAESKICAVDENWTAMKYMLPKDKRK